MRLPLLLLLLIPLLFSRPLLAATFTVSSTRDEPDALPGDGVCAARTGHCTLRAAVEEANAQPDADTIVLPAGRYALTRQGDDDTAHAGDLDVTGALTITGAGARATVIDAHRARNRVFEVLQAAALDLGGVTLRGGRVRDAVAGGGCLRVLGTLALHDAVVTGCRSVNDAGAIDVQQAVATLTDVKLVGNRTADDGGAMDVDGGTVTLLRVLVAGNRAADEGGGLENSGGTMTLREVRIIGNRAPTDAGGLSIEDGATTLLDGCTIKGNRARQGGGLFTEDTEHGVNTTIITGTTLRRNTRGDCVGNFVDGGKNAGGASCAFTP